MTAVLSALAGAAAGYALYVLEIRPWLDYRRWRRDGCPVFTDKQIHEGLRLDDEKVVT